MNRRAKATEMNPVDSGILTTAQEPVSSVEAGLLTSVRAEVAQVEADAAPAKALVYDDQSVRISGTEVLTAFCPSVESDILLESQTWRGRMRGAASDIALGFRNAWRRLRLPASVWAPGTRVFDPRANDAMQQQWRPTTAVVEKDVKALGSDRDNIFV